MNELRATRYQRLRRRARAAGLASGGLMLAWVALTPSGAWVARAVEAYGQSLPPAPHAFLSVTLFAIVLVLLWEIASLPAMLYLAVRVDRRYVPRTPAVEEVLGAQLSATGIVLPAVLVTALIVQWSAWVAGGAWWLVAGLLLAVSMVAAMHGVPALLARLSGARPMDRDAVIERLAALARRAGVEIYSIDIVPDERGEASAVVAGAGRSRRVFISSDMALNWTPEEIEVVVAHELAHHAHHDLWRTLALDAVLLSAALACANAVMVMLAPARGLPSVGTLEALPLIGLLAGVVWLAVTPIRHALSRAQERRADAFALALTGGTDAFASAVRRLSARHLVEEQPSTLTRWLHHRHPSVAERLALAGAAGPDARPPAPRRR